MATFILQSSGRFPVGTSVSAYKRANWPGYQQGSIAGAPVGSSDATATVASDGSLTLTGLADLTRYVAYASVSSEDRYVGFQTGNPAAPGADQGTPGSPVPAEAELVGGSDGTNLRALLTDALGALGVYVVRPGGAALSFAPVSVASSGDNSLVSAVAAKKIKVVSYVIVADGAVTARWYSGAAGTALSGAMSLAASGGVAAAAPAGLHLFETAVNTALVLNLGGAIGVRGHLGYFAEA